ncbi:hypothetical protein JTE90_007828 [Oedothorax gibbosus]|uniref:Structure-specific endonuclease subunit SLX4 n=1 Tax=Oedothorax gibbosus TaxID=931172 RepID=A0AAV6VJK5_9ARAC|nr:hypothetical protein JTE90_007828 [Oedothorax gibbosus]
MRKGTSQPTKKIPITEKENLFSQYIYAPSTSYKPLHAPTSLRNRVLPQNTQLLTMEVNPNLCINSGECIMDEDISEVPPKDPKIKSKSLKSSSSETSSLSARKTTLNETFDDFQENKMENRVKSKIAGKKQEDLSFVCMMCQKDFTHLTIEERTLHVNQCIDYHSSAVATSQSSSPTTIVLDCPLCFKSQPSHEARKTHIKKCGKSKGLSVQSVIQAVHLQEKHALERQALGLPLNVKPKPVKTQKKPAVKKCALEPKSAMQSDIQLAKALSLSLKENESQSQSHIPSTSGENLSIERLKPPAEFQNPGRPPPKKKRGITQTPLLVLRTEEERTKIISDKVNAVIVSSSNNEAISENFEEREHAQGKNNAAYLWNLSSTAVEKSQYYVEQLLDWIKPSDVEIGSKLCNLSQVAGHRIYTQLPCDYTFSCNNNKDETEVAVDSDSSLSLTNSLRSLIGNFWMSDVDIHTASGIVIPAHKLLLALRCPALKNAFDAPIVGSKHILNWENTSFDAALHFLNFIYTGATEWKEEIIDELTQLAKKYKVDDLLEILNDSETLELLICEDPETSAITPMDHDSAHKDVNLNVDSLKSKEDSSILPQGKDPALSFSGDLNPLPNNYFKEFNPIAVQPETDFECTFIKMSNSTYSLNVTHAEAGKSNDDISMLYPETIDCIEDKDSSNDSCKIVSPIKSCKNILDGTSELSPEKNSNSNFTSLKSPPRTYLNHSFKDCSPYKIASNGSCSSKLTNLISSKLDSDILDCNNQDVLIVKELGKRNSLSFNDTLPLESDHESIEKHSTFPSVFLKENEDLDAAICLSQNVSFQNQSVNNMNVSVNNPNKELTTLEKHSCLSPEKLQLNSNSKYSTSISPLKSGSLYSESHKFNKMSCFDYNECEMNVVSSPEILVCDSDDENVEHASSNENNFSQNASSIKNNFVKKPSETENSPVRIFCYDSDVNFLDKTKLNSPNKYNDNLFCHDSYNQSTPVTNTFITSEKLISSNKSRSPELICCDSNSDDKLDVVACLPFSNSNKASDMQNVEDCITLETDNKNSQGQTMKTSPYKNSSLSSPESPWTFKTCNSSEDVSVSKELKSSKSSSVSSQLRTNLESKYSKTNDKCNSKSDSSVSTPKDLVKFKISDSPITPLPDYGKMMTPQIKEALKKIGVKAMPRKKAVAVLSHIYNETHPWNDGSSSSTVHDVECTSQTQSKSQKKNLSLPKKRKGTAQTCEGDAKKKMKKCTSTLQNENDFQDKVTKKPSKSCCLPNEKTGSSSSQKDFPVFDTSPESVKNISSGSNNSRNGEEPNLNISSELSDGGLPECKENTKLLRNYILAKDELYTKILNYMPINLMEFQQELKENGIKISVKQLTDYLDEQCITFTYPRKEEYKKKQQVRTQRFRKRMIAKLSQQGSSNIS